MVKTLRIIKTDSLVERVVSYIQGEIAENRLRANQKISENQIAKVLGISRSPVREALRILDGDGLIKLVPGKGSYVQDVTPEDACALFLIRSCLIGLAVRLATPAIAERLLAKYRSLIKALRLAASKSDSRAFLKVASTMEKFFAAHSGSLRLKRLVEVLGNPCLKYRAFLASVPGYMDEIVHWHQKIAKAIEQHNAVQAESYRRAISDRGAKLIYRHFLSHYANGRSERWLDLWSKDWRSKHDRPKRYSEAGS